MYALIDGNNFYASCEKVFQPKLNGQPVVVLSNNDGCIVTLTKEAKSLGLKRGMPLFQAQDIISKERVVVFSSNYELYGDMSRRMMETISSLVPEIYIYSIDECFALLNDVTNLTELGFQIRARVLQWVGIPTCVGIAPTKTLAKFCNHLAKRYPAFKGVLNWNDLSRERQRKAMSLESIENVWGIGRGLAKRLNTLGIETVLDLINFPASQLRAYFPVTLLRTVQELNGIEAIEFEFDIEDRQQVLRSRSFSREVYELEQIQSAIAMHAEEAAKILRAKHQCCHSISTFIYSNRFKPEAGNHNGYDTYSLIHPINDTTTIRNIAVKLTRNCWKHGIGYKKAGVILQGLEKETDTTLDLFSPQENLRKQKLSAVIDQLNARWGKGTIQSALILSPKKDWQMKREHLSPSYTTRWNDVLHVF